MMKFLRTKLARISCLKWFTKAALLFFLYVIILFLPKPSFLCDTEISLQPIKVHRDDTNKIAFDLIDTGDEAILSMFPIYSRTKSESANRNVSKTDTFLPSNSDTSGGGGNNSQSKVKVFRLQNFNFLNFGRTWQNELPHSPANGTEAKPKYNISDGRQANFEDLSSRNLSMDDITKYQKMPDCVFLKVPYGATPTRICVHYRHVDNFISSRLRDSGTWETEFLTQMEEFFRANPRSQLVDLGCNIGVYSLYAASVGKPSVAVDILPSNLALIQLSIATNDKFLANDNADDDDVDGILQLMGYRRANRPKYSDLITTLHNAVYRKRTKMYVYLKDDLNLGGTEVKEAIIASDNTPISVDAVCLDDLIPYVRPNHSVFLKMDVEGAEPDVLMCASKFFMYVDVKVVLMEILFHKYSSKGKDMARFLLQQNMLPFEDGLGHNVLETDLSKMHTWPENMFWIKVR